jgi:hypothetical protein
MKSRDFQTMLIQLRAAGCRVQSKRKGGALTYRVYNSGGVVILTANRLRGYYAIKSNYGTY